LAFAVGEAVERRIPGVPGEEACRDLGVDDRFARGQSGERVLEGRPVGDVVLQHVADASLPVGEQFGGEGRPVVGREHQHSDGGMGGLEATRCQQAFVALGRRHSHVDDGDVGWVVTDEGDQLVTGAAVAAIHPEITRGRAP
jgi:hypothetical protein